jgi:hypothetical protein
MNLINQGQPRPANKKLAQKIIKHPHLLGHYFGYVLLTELHSEWIRNCYFDPEDNSLQAHRGSYKTTAIIVVGVIWWLWFHFEDRVAIIRKDFTAAAEVLSVVSKILKSPKAHALFIAIYGFDYVLTVDKNNTITWNLKKTQTPQGSISCYSMGEDMTGTHFDRILIDDFVTIKDRISKTVRESTKLFIQDLRANIIDPGKPIIFSGTPWHPLDAWTILPLPVKYDIYNSKIARFTKKYVEYLKSITSHSLFAANYELRHVASEDQMFKEPVYCQWDYTLKPVGHIDAKYSGSHTGAFTMMAKRPDGKVQAVIFKFDRHIVDDYQTIVSLWKKYRCGTVCMEENADKGYAARDLANLGMLTRTYHERENKHVKIVQNLKTHWHQIEWCEDSDPEAISQILDYAEKLEPDDCADSGASCIREHNLFMVGNTEMEATEFEDDYRE